MILHIDDIENLERTIVERLSFRADLQHGGPSPVDYRVYAEVVEPNYVLVTIYEGSLLRFQTRIPGVWVRQISSPAHLAMMATSMTDRLWFNELSSQAQFSAG